jgi:hypothetical protein
MTAELSPVCLTRSQSRAFRWDDWKSLICRDRKPDDGDTRDPKSGALRHAVDSYRSFMSGESRGHVQSGSDETDSGSAKFPDSESESGNG